MSNTVFGIFSELNVSLLIFNFKTQFKGSQYFCTRLTVYFNLQDLSLLYVLNFYLKFKMI